MWRSARPYLASIRQGANQSVHRFRAHCLDSPLTLQAANTVIYTGDGW
jgi:hypothetical protein